MIRKKGSKYCLYSRKSGRNLGCSRTKAGARKREREVEYFKSHPRRREVRVREHRRRRIGTVSGVEVHHGTSIDELGKWEGTYISDYDRAKLEENPHALTFVTRHKEPGGEVMVSGTTGHPELTRSYRMPGNDFYEIDALLIATVEGDEAQIVLAESTRSGEGSRIVRAFEKYARSHNVNTIYLIADDDAVGFWTKMGYSSTFENFMEKRV